MKLHPQPALTLQVFDLRASPRLLSSIPFGAGPSMLRFHPKFSSTLLVAGAQGVFVLADASGASYNRTYQACLYPTLPQLSKPTSSAGDMRWLMFCEGMDPAS